MAFTWYSVGLLEEMTTISDGLKILQEKDSSRSRTSPYFAVSVSGQNQYMRNVLPEPMADGYFSQFINVKSTTTLQGTTKLISLRKSDGTTELAYILLDMSTQIATAYVSGSSKGTFTWSTDTGFQLEVRLKLDAVTGIFQVWKNGERVVDFTGNTGASTDLIWGISYGYGSSLSYSPTSYYSDFVYTTAGRVGNKRPVIVPLTGAGDASPTKYYDFVGNRAAGADSTLTVGRTYIVGMPFAAAGTVKTVVANFNTTGTVYLGICTRNQTTATKHARRLVSSQITVGATGVNTFTAGIDFPDNWTVVAGEYLAIFVESAQLKAGYFPSNTIDYNGRNFSGAYYYTGNGFVGITELTYIVGSTTYCEAIYAQYEVANPSLAYNQSIAVDRLARKDFVEGVRYAELASENDAMLCHIGDIPFTCTGVKSVKVTARALAGTSLPNAEWILQMGSDSFVMQGSLPTSLGLKSMQFDGTWSPVQFNSAQIGLKAKA